MQAVLATVNDPHHHGRIEAIALERGGVALERGDSGVVIGYASVPAAVRSAFDMLAEPEVAEGLHIGISAGEDRVLPNRLAGLAPVGSMVIDETTYGDPGVDAERFAFLGERLFPNAGETVRLFRGGVVSRGDAASRNGPAPREELGAPPLHGDAGGIRPRLLEVIRLRGTRPTRSEAIRLLRLHSQEELAELGVLERRGFLRLEPEVVPAPPDDDLEDFSDRSEPDPYDGSLGRLLKRRRDLDDPELYEIYRVTFEKRLARERAGLAAHTGSFLGVNAFLAGIWGITGAGFPWFLFPLFGWGIGWVSHKTSQSAREQEYAEVAAMPDAGRSELRAHRKLWKLRRSWRGHLASNLATMALLGMINVITGSSFPWALIPSAAMGIGLITHYGSFRHRERQLLDEGLISLPDRRSVRAVRRGEPGGTSKAPMGFLARARAIQRQIEREIEELPEAASLLGGDFRQVLADYIAQLEIMDTTERDVRELIAGIPMAELDREYERIRSRLSRNPDAPVAKEYRSSLDQIDRQRASYRELTSELEVLELRGGSALHALNQLRIDVVRTKNTRGGTSSIEDLRERSLEISRYLEDLRSGYEELS